MVFKQMGTPSSEVISIYIREDNYKRSQKMIIAAFQFLCK